MKITAFEDVSHGRNNNFNLIRMVAASAVLVSHAYPISLGPDTIQPLETVLDGTTLGTVAVLVFFAISGFLITKSYDRSRDWRRFLQARFWRLFPALAFVLLVTVLFAGLFLTTAPMTEYLPGAATYILRNLTLAKLQYPLPGVFDAVPYGPPINGSLWTLFYEVLCYLGVLALGLAGILGNRSVSGAVLVALVVFQVAMAYTELPGRVEELIHLGTPFAVGSWIYVWRRQLPSSVWIAAALVIGALLLRGTPVFHPALGVSLAYAALAVGFARMPVLLHYNRLGDFSYGTYVFAFPIQQLVASYGAVAPTTNIAIALPLTLGMAVLSWHFIESPALKFAHRPARPSAQSQ